MKGRGGRQIKLMKRLRTLFLRRGKKSATFSLRLNKEEARLCLALHLRPHSPQLPFTPTPPHTLDNENTLVHNSFFPPNPHTLCRSERGLLRRGTGGGCPFPSLPQQGRSHAFTPTHSLFFFLSLFGFGFRANFCASQASGLFRPVFSSLFLLCFFFCTFSPSSVLALVTQYLV